MMRVSKRTLRKIRHARRASQVATINLVSMIDVFVIMVIYLLVNAAAVQVVGAEHVELPQSIAEQPPKEENVAVTVSGNDIFVNGKKVMDVREAGDAQILQPLRAELLTFVAPPDVAAKNNKEAVEQREVSILADKKIPYSLLKKVMATCADAGFARIALGVFPSGGNV